MIKNEDCLALPLLLSDGSGLYWTREHGYVRSIEYITANCEVYPVTKRNGEHWVRISIGDGPSEVTIFHMISKNDWEVRLFRGN